MKAKNSTSTVATPDNLAGHVTPVGGNVFVDLGFEPAEATALFEQSQKAIAKKLAIKAQLMDTLATWMESEKLTQAKAATVLGISRPRVSDVIRHKNSNFTVDALIDMVVRTGKTVQISI
ncbi:MAG TPA: helix-turn-helix transcriptional regulator [Burkholderiaceae bacterium]|nr:helix-turn-helix transcriptional regulator [Burkholderiaceae bacterium]